MKFIHIADLHANRARIPECLKVLDTLYDYIVNEVEKPYLLISGDFWDSAIQNTENSGFTEYISAIKKIIDVTKVFIITGTPFHEPAGSCEVFKTLGAYVFDKNTFKVFDDFELVAIPEPRKYDYVTDSIEKTYELINNTIQNFIENLPVKTKPRIVMYHGEIKGAVFDNGMTASSPVALHKDLLLKTNADYIACGHIHYPQKVFDNCYYAGSCFPVNAGEHHLSCFNDVTIDNGTSVQKVSFGFPVNITEECLYLELDKFKKRDFHGANLTVKLKLEKILKKSFDQRKLEQEIKESTGASKVRVEFVYETETNIRSEQIVKEKSVVEKFKIYCDLNEISYTEETINKLQTIQDSLIINSYVPCDSFELEYLSLKGSIGIKDGLGLDEFSIDFTKYKNGVLGLIGHNGSGKSTLLENCHPYPQMLTRKGSLKEHFCLKNSHRILIYRCSNGQRIKISMFIDGTTKDSTSYLVERKKDENSLWVQVKSATGTKDSYLEWVQNTFGSVDMFMRTSFYANKHIKGLPELSDATKAEKMELFTKLAGTDYLTSISDIAKTKQKEIDDIIKDIKKDLKNYDELTDKLNRAEIIISENSQLIQKEENQLKQDDELLKEYETKHQAFLEAIGSSNILRKDVVSKRIQVRDIEKEILILKNNIEELEKEEDKVDFYKEQIEWWNNSIVIEEELRKKKDSLNEDIRKYGNTKTEIQLAIANLSKSLSDYKQEFNDLKLDYKLKSCNLKKINNICPVCGEPLSEHKKEEIERENGIIQEALDVISKKMNNLQEEKLCTTEVLISDKNKEFNTVQEQQNVVIDDLQKVNADLTELTNYRDTVDIDKAKEIVYQLQPLLEKNSQELQELFSKKNFIEDEIKKIEEQLASVPDDISDKLTKLKNGMLNSRESIAVWNTEIKQAEKDIAELKDKIEQVREIDRLLKEHTASSKDYGIIHKAFSNNGIQALELDSAAPEISIIANQILSSTYGDRFAIKFETQKDAKDGHKIDDFIINVFDGKTGRVKRLDTLCSGESVWIKQALYYAFSVVRSRHSGFCFKTRFLDEADGALDSESRIKYLKMINSAHRACGANLTILVTHSQEIKDILEQKLELFTTNFVS